MPIKRSVALIGVYVFIAFVWALLLPCGAALAATDTYGANGSWVAPPGVTSVTVEAWGGGGGGGGATGNPSRGGGGAGGQYASAVLTVVPGNTYAIVVGGGGAGSAAAGGAGGDSSFAATSVVAKGGTGGALAAANNSGGAGGAGSTTGGVGTVVRKGGNGSAGVASGSGGAGGGGAGSSANGGDASGNTAGAGGATGGGVGATGIAVGTGAACTNSATVAGGGGCGGNATSNTDRSGGAGAAGQVVLTYVLPPTVVSINRANTNPNTSNASVSWTVVFSQSVTGVNSGDFALVMGGGASGASITSVTGAGTTWTVTANSGTAYGTLGLNLVDDDSIVNGGAAPLGGSGAGNGNWTGAVYTLAAAAVQLSKVASAAAAAVGDLVTFTIIASNPYSVDLPALTVSDVLPTGMVYAANVVTAGTLGVSGQTVTWSLPGVLAGGSAQLTLVVSLTQQGALTNMVTSTGATSASASVLALASAVTHFHLDEPVGSWNGTAGEVLDSGGTALHGRRVTTTTPTTTNTYAPSPTIASQYPAVVGGFCNAARFEGNAVVEVADSPLFDYTNKLSASAWIYPTAYPASDLYSILSNDQNYEFHLNTTGKLFWWWGSASFSSAATIPLNQWTHVAITMDSSATGGRQRIYINGVLDANSNNWKGTLATNTCKFYIGGDVSTGSCALIPGRNFRGSIDEVKLYSYELSAAEVQADMTLGRNCGGTFDHVRIEHDGAASVCTPETVTIKACLNASCSTLYPGNVTVNLSPTGWVGGDTVVLTNGVGTRSLSVGTPGNVTLGSAGTTPTAANNTRCFNGGTETCTLNFTGASCSFDAVETGAAAQTRLFTKLANTAFNVDVLALNSGTTINTGYTGDVTVDLVDASSSSCPAGAALATQSVTFASGNNGRKPVTFTYANAMPNVRVRMTAGASAAACSTDNFAIRPSTITLLTSPAMAAGVPSASATPTIKAGANFTLQATTVKGPNYDGTLVLDTTTSPTVAVKLTAQVTSQDTSQASGGVVGTLSPTTLVGNATAVNASYSEVGYLYLAAGAFRDDTFTAVDQPTGCAATSSCDCVTSTLGNANLADTLASGKYGCSIGSTSAALGRFVPDHFLVTSGTLLNRQAAACPVASPSSFSYAGETVQINNLKLTARNAFTTPTTTQNYRGVFARFDGTTVANFGWGAVDLVVAPLTETAFALGTGAGQLDPVSSTGTWTDGVGTFSASLRFNRTVAPTGPYESVRVGIAPTDPDAVGVRAAALDLDISVPADAVKDKVLVGSTRVRWGRMRLQNMYGSEYLPLAVPVQAEYWLPSGFVANTDDSCTPLSFPVARTLAAPDGVVNTYFYPVAGKNQLAAADTTRTVTTTGGVGTTRLVSAKALLGMSKPNKIGWLDILLDVPDYLRYNWGNCLGQAVTAGLHDDYPCARATFGVYKSPLIYRRENY